MIEDLQKRKPSEEPIKQLMHAKLYLFLTNPEERYTSPGLAVVGSSNFTAEGLAKNKELNVLLTLREEVLYLNKWFDNLWEEALEFREDLLKVIDFSGDNFYNGVILAEAILSEQSFRMRTNG